MWHEYSEALGFDMREIPATEIQMVVSSADTWMESVMLVHRYVQRHMTAKLGAPLKMVRAKLDKKFKGPNIPPNEAQECIMLEV